eukprot:c9919_g1_i1 orf=190-1983(-)
MACKLIRVGHSWSFTRYVSISVETSSVTESFSEEEEGIYLNKSLTSDHFPKEAGKTFALAESSDAAAGLSRLHLYASCLRNCSNRKDLALGRTLHNLIITCGFGGNTLLSNLLLQLYGCCVAIEDAEASFSIMPRRNLLSFNYMLSGHVQNGDNIACCKIFQQMQLQGIVPNKITFIIMLSACTHSISAGRKLHALIIERGLALDVFVGTAVVTMYEKTGLLKDAHTAFNLIVERNVVSWNAMISAFCHHGYSAKAMYFFHQMMMEGILPTRITYVCLLYAPMNLHEGQQVHVFVKAHECQPNIVVENALVNLYGKCGRLEDAERLFKSTSNSNLVTFNAMIDAYIHNRMIDSAYQYFKQMYVECLIPNSVTFISMLSLCAFLGALQKGKQMHACISSSGLEVDVVLNTSLINMYGKCGCIVVSCKEFDRMRTPNTTSWNTMLAAYAQHGQGEEAEALFHEMQLRDTVPDEVSFVSLIMACTHVGLVEKGWRYFASMKFDFGIKANLEHYHCMIDLLGRAGQLDELEVLLETMPFEASGTSWMTLLGACRTHLDVQRGANAAENVYAREPENAAPFLMLSSIQGSQPNHCKETADCK